MNSFSFIISMFEQAGYYRLLLAGVLGAVVCYIYLFILKFSVNILNKSKHKVFLFISLVLVRFALFFGILMLIANKNIAIILVYFVAFMITKKVVLITEKRKIKKLSKGGEND